jgi:ABC-type antimicrobial peptide transport system permease subunit
MTPRICSQPGHVTAPLATLDGRRAYVLAQRTREIGIRVALGAKNAQVKRMLLGHVLALVGLGVALGWGAAALLTRLMESLLFGVSVLDPATYAVGSAVLIATAALAGYLPARRATLVDPISSLRAE